MLWRTVSPTVMAKPSCQARGAGACGAPSALGAPAASAAGSGPSGAATVKVSCRKEATAKPATMPDRKLKLRSCSARSSCVPNENRV